MKNKKKILLIILVVILTSVFCFMLYQRNHKAPITKNKTNMPLPAPKNTNNSTNSNVEISEITFKNVNSTQATIIWKTNVSTTSQVLYAIFPIIDLSENKNPPSNYQFSTFVESVLNTSHNAFISNLKPNTKYYYQIISFDKEKNKVSSKVDSFTTTSLGSTNRITNSSNGNVSNGNTNLPIKVTSSLVKSITSNGAVISFRTNVLSTGKISYGTNSGVYTSSVATNDGFSTSHDVALNNLLANQKIFYKITSFDSKGEKTVSDESSFIVGTVSVSGAPTVSFFSGSSGDTLNASFAWKTNVPTTSQILYQNLSSNLGSYNSQTPLDTNLLLNHSFILNNLVNNMKFYYRIVSIDSKGVKSISAEYTFSTPAPNYILAKDITTNSANITWDTPIKSTSKVTFGTISGLYTLETPLDTNLFISHSVSLKNLQHKTKYYYKVISSGTGIVNATSEEHSFSTF